MPYRRICSTCRASESLQYYHRRKRERPEDYRRARFGFFKNKARHINWKRSGHGNVTARQLRDLWRQQNGKCALTGEKLTRQLSHLDHIVPISRGGRNVIENVRWVHPLPNLLKGAKLDSEIQCGPAEEFPF